MTIKGKRQVGDRGEQIVADFLIGNGFKVVERNHWRKWGELDIVAWSLKDRHYHFVEVKTVVRDLARGDAVSEIYSPADNMTNDKKRRFSRVIQTYLSENNLEDSDWQADVALVYIDRFSAEFKIEILEDVDL